MKDNNGPIVNVLNEALADEYAQFIEMATQASLVAGEQALYLKSFFDQQAEGALRHAGALRERIFFLGGKPGTDVGKAKVYGTVKEALDSGVADHQRFVERYRKILSFIKRADGDILYETIEGLLEDEQTDLEAFRRLSGKIV